MSSPTPIEFLFDFISPNAYLAWTQIHGLADRFHREVHARPVLFAGLLRAHGRPGPAEVRPMARWMFRNCLRKASHLGVPLNPPHSHPFNPLLALRTVTACEAGASRRRAIDAIFRATWGESADVTRPETIVRILDEVGLAGTELVGAATSPTVKSSLREATDHAVERGVFGVPTMLVADDLFWGYDDFPHLERALAGADPLPRESMDAWANVRPSSTRREATGQDGTGSFTPRGPRE